VKDVDGKTTEKVMELYRAGVRKEERKLALIYNSLFPSCTKRYPKQTEKDEQTVSNLQ
jgi:hypothetical protein